ncbi:MAG: hypothetical protein O7D28_06225 [Actinobacteria bacterium]|nr:hypothetical protein [Actinomycetota bacterium]
MDEERQEVYERIPWETLEKQGGDRQWLVIAVAGAVAVGALAYSFTKSQPAPPPTPTPVEAAVTDPPVTTAIAPVTSLQTPLVMAEADLYAIDPERIIDQAKALAEWFAVEYFAVDGSEQSQATLGSLMPSGVPLPEAPAGTQVFVDWVGVQSVTETAPLSYDIAVLVRSLMAQGDGGFVRQPTRVATIVVVVGDDGLPRVARPPAITTPPVLSPVTMTLNSLPATLEEQVESAYGLVVGGEQLEDGVWRVVAMVEGVDGVRRPTIITVP